MGAASSTQTKTDPHTGQTKTKHKMGGSFPGNRRQAHNTYAPPASEFSNGKATSHFVNYGGGNALVLKQGGMAKPQMGAATATATPPEYIQVTLPQGVHAGQTIRVAAPDGRLNEITIPQGFGPGSTFTVEFAPPGAQPPQQSKQDSYGYGSAAPTATAAPAQAIPPPQQNDYDDGFATGFNNPNFVQQATPASSVGADDYSSYPSATDAQPIYAETSEPVYSASYAPYVSKK
uniref:Uncharacterized protein n=1 Tax=Pseudo-nitzschia australis TaxID=44445 RepID=A0A7S4A9U4_9STRA|mmetsp:Transcript_22250/g.46774  ORF Transcript_22250/g.46774 Transcript_22250/m.46774 type:complete len:233 (+) Transcript_22250:187-885(+)|eukprot:CAMPEP_0168183582 /NCGR_PEP_ID=MMETSP0139_2-20121125/12657_1 /TAXON_ID=44445 /ORGANISM="Pseudo-nitzschia australis, Strain 10249 10 AB" /LENGTH=232 /DNA_ID=CAMNT_0008104895 /DNA_START=121 /DNA_END=819 /DNA_ORIENTATION=-